MDPVRPDPTLYLIEGVGDEVTFLICLIVFVLSIVGSIQLLPESIQFLRDFYQNNFAPREEPRRPESEQSTSSPERHNSNGTEAKYDDGNQRVTAARSETPLTNNNKSMSKDQEKSEEAAPHQNSPKGRETERVDSDSEHEAQIPTDNQDAVEQQDDNVADQTANSSDEAAPPSRTAIDVRLKYLNDTERTVTIEPSETIGSFKRIHFHEELSNQKQVRLIYNGQLLRENITIQNYGIVNGTVVHVQISETRHPQTTQVNVDLDLAGLMLPLFSLMLAVFWVLYFKYPEYFTMLSIVILVVLTVSFFLVYVRLQVPT